MFNGRSGTVTQESASSVTDSDYTPAKLARDRDQIQSARVHTNIRYIRYPDLVRTRSRDVLEHARIHFVLLVRHGMHLRSFLYIHLY
jgi:hypothetical protein